MSRILRIAVALSCFTVTAGGLDAAFAQSRDLPQGDARGFQPPIDRTYRPHRYHRPYVYHRHGYMK